MDRTEYLNLCKRVSILLPTIPKLLSSVPTDCIVEYDGIEYYPDNCDADIDLDEVYEVDGEHLCLDCLKERYKKAV